MYISCFCKYPSFHHAHYVPMANGSIILPSKHQILQHFYHHYDILLQHLLIYWSRSLNKTNRGFGKLMFHISLQLFQSLFVHCVLWNETNISVCIQLLLPSPSFVFILLPSSATISAPAGLSWSLLLILPHTPIQESKIWANTAELYKAKVIG